MNFSLNPVKALLGAAVVAGVVTAISQPARAISFNVTAGPTSTFSGVTTVDFSDGVGTLPGGYTENGISFTGGAIRSGDADNLYAQPPGTANPYLALGGSGSQPSPVTIALNGLKGYFGLFIGSIDDYNSIEFFRGADSRLSVSGVELAAAAGLMPNGDQSEAAYFNFFGDNGSDLFDRVVLRSSQAAFEVDNIATREAIPTPALLPGLIGMGVAAWRKRKSEAAES